MKHDNSVLFLGPPGTGKTTTLVDTVGDYLGKGGDPARVAYVSFTRAAAQEALHRTTFKLKMDAQDFPWFRTLHSTAYKLLGCDYTDMFGIEDAKFLGKREGMYFGLDLRAPLEDVGFGLRNVTVGNTEGNRLLSLDNLSRVRRKDLRETWTDEASELQWLKVDYFQRMYSEYKQQAGVLDFTDLLSQASTCATVAVPELDLLVVDEGQDLSRLQWELVQRLADNATRLVLAGDDDQSIYSWSGADLDTFLNLKTTKKEVLSKTFRLPRCVFDVAEGISEQISERYPKTWSTTKKKGSVTHVTKWEKELDLQDQTKDWLLLFRNLYLMKDVEDYLVLHGLPFSAPSTEGIKDYMSAIETWERLSSGQRAKAEDVRLVYDLMPCGPTGVRRGHKTLPEVEAGELLSMDQLRASHGLAAVGGWMKALPKIPDNLCGYFSSAMQRGELLKRPRITLSTIHGAKGQERDNVALWLDMSDRTRRGMDTDPDSEHRVFYVGVTRTLRNLYLVQPTTSRHYTLPRKAKT